MTARILFVCHGNICRSTMAQFVMDHLVREAGRTDVECDSAATSTEELGNPVHRGTRRILAEKGVRCGTHRARRLTQADYDRFDLIVGMDEENLSGMRWLIREDPEHKLRLLLDWTDHPRDIADPWYTGNFERTYEDVLEGCQALLAALPLGE